MLSFNDENKEKNSYKSYFDSDYGGFIVVWNDAIFNGYDKSVNDF